VGQQPYRMQGGEVIGEWGENTRSKTNEAQERNWRIGGWGVLGMPRVGGGETMVSLLDGGVV